VPTLGISLQDVPFKEDCAFFILDFKRSVFITMVGVSNSR